MTTIRLEAVRKQFDRNEPAVNDLTLTFTPGSTTCLLGPSGCGKTTLMRMIAGLESPTSGRIFFDDVDVTNMKTRRRDLGMVFQYPVVYRGTTVRENVELPLRREPLSKLQKVNRVNEVLETLRLEPHAYSNVDRLDNATRQKVAVARAIARRPPIVLFDEPVTNVDINAKLQLKRDLKELFTRHSQTVLYVTHDQTEAMTLADEIALMRNGRIEQLDSPRQLYGASQSVFGGWFLGNPGMNFVSIAQAPSLAQQIGGVLPPECVTIGFRPEDVRIVGVGVAATVEHVAIVSGGQLLVSMTADGVPVKAKLPFDALVVPRQGDVVALEISTARVSAFDASEHLVARPGATAVTPR